jgi:hypothetical protein
VLLGPLQASLDQVDIPLGSRSAFPRFLLKGMQDINQASELDGIDGTVSIAVEVIDDFKDTRPPNPLSALADGCSSPCSASSIACPITRRTSRGNSRKSSLDEAIHSTGFGVSIHSGL